MTDSPLTQFDASCEQLLKQLDWLGPQTTEPLRAETEARAPRLVSDAMSDSDTAAESVRDILHAVHGDRPIPPAWWATPLGRVCAVSFAGDDDCVPITHAAEMLGIAPKTVRQRLDGDAHAPNSLLERHAQGGVVRGSIHREMQRRLRTH